MAKRKGGNKPFDPNEFEARLADLMASLKYWGKYGSCDEDLDSVWVSYLRFRKQYKKFVRRNPEPGMLMNGLFDSISVFLSRATESGVDPDKYFLQP